MTFIYNYLCHDGRSSQTWRNADVDKRFVHEATAGSKLCTLNLVVCTGTKPTFQDRAENRGLLVLRLPAIVPLWPYSVQCIGRISRERKSES